MEVNENSTKLAYAATPYLTYGEGFKMADLSLAQFLPQAYVCSQPPKRLSNWVVTIVQEGFLVYSLYYNTTLQ